MATYSFQDNMCSISGPHGSFSLGSGAGDAEGGISVVMTEDKSTMTIGADGSVMHSLHAGKSATVTVRLLKTSPTNALLSAMYAADCAFSQAFCINTISIRDMARNDVIVCQMCAWAKFADVTYAKEGGEMTWTFHAGIVDFILGTGLAAATGIAA